MIPFICEKLNCWQRLQNEKKPIFIYGMGNGASKIMSVMREFGIAPAGIFASDEFVRGHTFEGYRVHKLSEIQNSLDDFAVVLAFAAGYPSLVEKIERLAQNYSLYVPDVPVAGNGLFTYEFCEQHQYELEQVYFMLHDNLSRRVFADIINFKISGNIDYLKKATTPKHEIYHHIIRPLKTETFVDLGAYNGDTVLELLGVTGGAYSEIFAVEPDKKSFKKLIKHTKNLDRIHHINAAAWSIDTEIPFEAKAGRQSSVSYKGIKIPAVSVDSLLAGKKPTFIKMDLEGCEEEAIWGACNSIAHHAPKLAVSIYHRNEDIFKIPLLVKSLRPDYRFFIRHTQYIPAWETNLYAVL